MDVRLKELRLTLKITQKAFADRIGTTQNMIANYESGRRNPSSSAINNICKEFRVNEDWLRNGIGEMFQSNSGGALDELVAQYGLSAGDRLLIEKFMQLSPQLRAGIIEYLTGLISSLSPLAATFGTVADEPLDPIKAAEELYRKSLGIAPSTASSASPTTADTSDDAV